MSKMKKVKKVWLRVLLVIVSFIVLLYVVTFVGHRFLFPVPYSDKPTVEPISKNGFTLGAASIDQPSTFEEYVQVVAGQVKHYQENIDMYWPNNPEKNQYLIAQNLQNKQAVLINPKGEVKEISKQEVSEYGVGFGLNTEGQWAPFEENGISGAYIGVIPNNLTNYYSYQRYEHLGTYDQFLSYSHELFHSITQERWVDADETVDGGAERDERLEDKEARRTRMLLQVQLKQAISDKKNRDNHTLDALKTYQTYQEKCEEDYEISKVFDRLEGTAYYYELVSSLYAAYPEQVKNQEDVYNALEVLMENDNPAYRSEGAVSEGYSIGGFAGILLDLKAREDGKDPNEWKVLIEQTAGASPMTLLEQEYEGNTLPKQEAIPTEEEYQQWLDEYAVITPKSSRATIVFDILYGILF